MRFFGFSLLFLIGLNLYSWTYAQTVSTLFEEMRSAYQRKDFRKVTDVGRQIQERCQQNYPDQDCRLTHVMRYVYLYKGNAEYTLYTEEENLPLLDEAINSLTTSYQLFADPEVAFNFGYMQSLRAIAKGDGDDLQGLVNAWRGILGLYAQDEWRISDALMKKLKRFIQQAVEITIASPDSAQTTGRFTGFMIRLACDLAEKKELTSDDQLFFSIYRQRTIDDEYNLRGNEWRSRGLQAQTIFSKTPNDSTYRDTRSNLELAYRYAKSAERRAEILKELSKVALFMEQNGKNSDAETELQYAREKARQAYELYYENRSGISAELEREIKMIYGAAILRLVNYYFSLAVSTDRSEAYNRARRIGEELLEPDGVGGFKQKFEWEGYEQLYLKLSDVGYELGDQNLAVDMIDKSWKAALKNYNLNMDDLCTTATPNIAKELLIIADNYRQISERFGLQSVLQWLRPIMTCLRTRSSSFSTGSGSGL
ncbi:hypothetical protein JW964_19865 [candidate division KSB1 bacterium]|nr:hypothetical protein [candidate division KSB1 bacterium]